MEITKRDFDEVAQLTVLMKKIDNIDAAYLDSNLDEIFLKQPFYLTVLLGHRLDTTPEELEEVMKIYLVVWEYFRNNINAQTKKVTEKCFDKNKDRLIKMLQYAEGEPVDQGKMEIYSTDLGNLKSKTLWAAVLLRTTNREALIKMDVIKKGLVLIGIKSFIECFETI